MRSEAVSDAGAKDRGKPVEGEPDGGTEALLGVAIPLCGVGEWWDLEGKHT